MSGKERVGDYVDDNLKKYLIFWQSRKLEVKDWYHW
jgi:hypothetical protein